MTANPETDFDGCNRECRKAGAHTLRWGGCERAAQPEPTVSMSMIYTDPEDGYPSIGFDSYTVASLADLVAPALLMPEEGFAPPYSESYARALAIAVAKAIVHRNDPGAAPAAVSSPPATDRATVYAEVAARLLADAEQGAKDGFTRIYRRSAADRVRVWADELAAEAQQPDTETQDACTCGSAGDAFVPAGHYPDCPQAARSDVGTEFVRQADQADQADQPDHEAMARVEAELEQSGVDTPGCDCGHDGMGVRWHDTACEWVAGLLAEARELLAKDDAAALRRQPDTEPLPLLFWDEPAGVVHHDGRVTAWISKAVNLAQSIPAGELILRVDAAQRLRRALTTALNDAAEQPAGGAGGVADETGEGGDRLVAHVLATGTDLHCLRCAPPPYGDIWTPVIADELEDGGVCVRCGVDVLIPQGQTPGCPAKHGALGRICELPTGHPGLHTGSGENGGAVWDGDAP